MDIDFVFEITRDLLGACEPCCTHTTLNIIAPQPIAASFRRQPVVTGSSIIYLDGNGQQVVRLDFPYIFLRRRPAEVSPNHGNRTLQIAKYLMLWLVIGQIEDRNQ